MKKNLLNDCICLMLCCLLLSCSGSSTDGQKDYLEACRLLRDGEIEPARELFRKITQNYPRSSFALKANEKLDEIHRQGDLPQVSGTRDNKMRELQRLRKCRRHMQKVSRYGRG